MIDDILNRRNVIITCGTGGVGKTTVSAALAIRAALLGKKTIVVTIDPAKRLANSLGLKSLSNEPTDITLALDQAFSHYSKNFSAGTSTKTPIGKLEAIVPDTRKTFEAFVRELAPSKALAEKVINNPIFETFSKEFSGTNEYMALERLLWIYKQEKYDTIIIDTPPSRNTLTFLNAPHVLSQFFEERLIRWFLAPSNKLISVGMSKAFEVLQKLTGSTFMSHLAEFSSSLFEVQEKFTVNLKKISSLLASEKVGFVIVSAPTPEMVPEIEHFIETLDQYQFYFDGIILNRTFGYLLPADSSHKNAGTEVIQGLQKREVKIIERLLRLSGLRSSVAGSQIGSMSGSAPICAKLPELARDVHSVEDLLHVAMAFSSRN